VNEAPRASIDKFRVARTLRDIAILLSLSGAAAFKSRAYRGGAAALEALSEDLGKLVEEQRLEEIPGIGPRLAAQIAEIWHTGRSSLLERLASELPPGSLELAGVPGLTVRRVRALYDAFGPLSLSEIARACSEHRVRQLPGLGARTEARILDGIRTQLSRTLWDPLFPSQVLHAETSPPVEADVSPLQRTAHGA
jgi:DNA polymerase (family 10)